MVLRCSGFVLGLLCSGFAVCGGWAKPLLLVSSRTLTAAGAAGAGAASGGKGAAVRGMGAGQRGYQDSSGAAAVGAAAKSQKVGQARPKAIPPIEVGGVSAEGGGSRRTGGSPQPLGI